MHNYQTLRQSDPKHKRYEDKPYLKWIDSRPCLVCSRKATHHHESITGKGTAIKCSDYEALPLCEICHERRHKVGKLTFWREHFFSCLPGITIEPVIDLVLAKLVIGYLSEYIQRGRKDNVKSNLKRLCPDAESEE